jgi:hypothetical protein
MRVVALALAVAALAFAAAPVRACCPCPQRGQAVRIAAQDVLIAYDAATKTEHFVRRARFDASANAQHFGFLVPTPSEPKLAESLDLAFDTLFAKIQPEVKTVNEWQLAPFSICCFPFYATRGQHGAAKSLDLTQSVRVLSEQRVAGYDATVLEADDTKALGEWLKAHDYDARPALLSWIEPYVVQKWKVTAFKYASGASKPDAAAPNVDLSTKAVRMSFSTEKPLFPYRVPEDNFAKPGEASILRVYYVGDRRVVGKLASGDAWPAVLKYSNAVEDMAGLLHQAVPAESLAANRWLTAFEDPTWPHGSSDLFFEASPDATPVIPPPIVYTHGVEIPIPLDLPLIALGVIVVVRSRRRRPAKPGKIAGNE